MSVGIKRKKCKCGCGKHPSLSYGGYFYACAPEDIKQRVGDRKQVAIKNANSRKSQGIKLRKEIRNNDEDKKALELWFTIRHHEMTGYCVCGCGMRSSKNDREWRSSIAHVLGKAKFKSVATHKDNWVELNYWDGCHSVFDDLGYEHCKNTRPRLWQIVVTKFKLIYPDMSEADKAKVPQVLLDTL